jgi:hypothetical protein
LWLTQVAVSILTGKMSIHQLYRLNLQKKGLKKGGHHKNGGLYYT